MQNKIEFKIGDIVSIINDNDGQTYQISNIKGNVANIFYVNKDGNHVTYQYYVNYLKLIRRDNITSENLEGIYKKTDDLLNDIRKHIIKCEQGKYTKSSIDTKVSVIYNNRLGEGYNIGNVITYLARYIADGDDKTNNPEDLLKAIHYLLFEYDRLKNNA